MGALTDSMRATLERRHFATLATHDPDGSIHLTPVWYLFEDEQLYVETASASRKARNIAERPSASIVIDVRLPGSEAWVSASGTAELVTGGESKEINAKILKLYLTKEALEDPKIGPGFEAGDDVAIRLKPTAWRSWRAKDLDDQFFGGLLCATPEKWFQPLEG